MNNLPMDLARVLKEAEGDAVDGRITPALVEETTCTVEVVEIVLIRLASPKLHVGDFKVAPEVARGVALSLLVVGRTPRVVCHPLHGAVVVEVLGALGEELDRLGPQGREGLGVVVKVDGEAVRLVVVVHVPEDVVVDVAEEVDVGLDAPVVPGVLERRVLVEQPAVPPAHLVVGDHLGVLDATLFEHPGRLVV